KAVLLCGGLAIRLFRGGGYGLDLVFREPGSPSFLIAGIAGVIVLASATSLTNFVRRPELTGKETPGAAHYETVGQPKDLSPVARAAWAGMTFLRFLNHSPSHIWFFALLDRLDAFFWIYVAINLLYLARGWLGLIVRFGRP